MFLLQPHQSYMINDISPIMKHTCAVWARRIGKTTALAYQACKWQQENPRSNIAIVGITRSMLTYVRESVKSFTEDFHGRFCSTSNQLRGLPVDALFIDEADFIDDKMISHINKILDVSGDQLIVRAYGTKNNNKKDGEHFWQTLHLGPMVNVFYCGAQVLPYYDRVSEQLRKDYFVFVGDESKKQYECEILSRP